jgi:hypothetical protein
MRSLGLAVNVSGKFIFFAGSIKGRYVDGQYDGKKLVSSNSSAISAIKQAYSAEIVKQQAKKLAWQLKKDAKKEKYTATKPNSTDKIEIEILDNGTIKTTTDKISMPNHASAEQFLLGIARDLGGEVTRTRRMLGTTQTITKQQVI